MKVAYQPRILRSMTEICAEFNVGRETVLAWHEAGAPIAREYQGKMPRYSCEVSSLQEWRVEHSRKA